MLPLTTVGFAVSSFVPWPKDSSRAPLAVSTFLTSATLTQSIDGAACSTVRFASVSISKLLPGRLTSPWTASAAGIPTAMIMAVIATSAVHGRL